MIGVTYQQAHKYERGINRVSAGRLFEIARALSTPITYFYEGVGEEGPRQITPHQRMQLEIARNFAEIRNEKHQRGGKPARPGIGEQVTVLLSNRRVNRSIGPARFVDDSLVEGDGFELSVPGP